MKLEIIQKTLADFFQVKVSDLKSKKRTQHVTFCRQVTMYLCRKLTESSFPAIGARFDRDHSTVIHAYDQIAKRAESDAAFRGSIKKIEIACRRELLRLLPLPSGSDEGRR